MTSRSRRLSSLIGNMRRASGHECRKSMHYIDSRALSLESPVSKHQKSLFKLLRSTRQSTAQSVVHRNGDIIIMKGGKIVSVRRAGEGKENSPLLDRLKSLKQTTQSRTDLLSGISGPGHVIFSIDGDEAANKHIELAPKKDSDGMSVGSDEVFSLDGNNRLKEVQQLNTSKLASGLNDNEIRKSKMNLPKLEIYNYDCEPRTVKTNERADNNISLERNKVTPHSILKPPRNMDVLQEISATNISSDTRNGKKHASNLPYLLPSLTNKAVGANTSVPSERHDIVSVKREDDLLSGMPLTPYTRDSLSKSDLNVSHIDPNVAQGKEDSQAPVPRSLQSSHSSENLFKKPPAVHRLMSVEFLDPPIQLFGSKSHAANRLTEKSKLNNKKKHSGLTEGKLNSKTLRLRSPFATRKIITQV